MELETFFKFRLHSKISDFRPHCPNCCVVYMFSTFLLSHSWRRSTLTSFCRLNKTWKKTQKSFLSNRKSSRNCTNSALKTSVKQHRIWKNIERKRIMLKKSWRWNFDLKFVNLISSYLLFDSAFKLWKKKRSSSIHSANIA